MHRDRGPWFLAFDVLDQLRVRLDSTASCNRVVQQLLYCTTKFCQLETNAFEEHHVCLLTKAKKQRNGKRDRVVLSSPLLVTTRSRGRANRLRFTIPSHFQSFFAFLHSCKNAGVVRTCQGNRFFLGGQRHCCLRSTWDTPCMNMFPKSTISFLSLSPTLSLFFFCSPSHTVGP